MDKLTGQFIADVFSQATKPEAKKKFLGVLAAALPNNPQLADTALTVTKTAATDQEWQVRKAAQQTLGVIVAKRPELADTARSISPDERLLELAQSIKSLPATRPTHPMAARMSQSVSPA